jgi:hypothetical protein
MSTEPTPQLPATVAVEQAEREPEEITVDTGVVSGAEFLQSD